jgi:SAM-dependent methyltransferase
LAEDSAFSPALHFSDRPEVDFSNIAVPHHLTPELLSYFPKARGDDSIALDLGCGDGTHSDVCEFAGFSYVGLDYDDPHAPMLGDGHALPFRPESFEFVLSIAALEHMRYPFVMMDEIHRVLQPGGVLIGSVAFLEPYHGASYFHHTHLGVLNCLQHAGFQSIRIAPNTAWPVLVSQRNGLFPRLPKPAYRALILPLHLLHRMWWKAVGFAARSPDEMDALRLKRTSGSLFFVARKPDRAGDEDCAKHGVSPE